MARSHSVLLIFVSTTPQCFAANDGCTLTRASVPDMRAICAHCIPGSTTIYPAYILRYRIIPYLGTRVSFSEANNPGLSTSKVTSNSLANPAPSTRPSFDRANTSKLCVDRPALIMFSQMRGLHPPLPSLVQKRQSHSCRQLYVLHA